MKPMIWHPEARDEKDNQYLESFNREPWTAISAVFLLLVCFFGLLMFVIVF